MKTEKFTPSLMMCIFAMLTLLFIVRMSLISTLILYYLSTNTFIL